MAAGIKIFITHPSQLRCVYSCDDALSVKSLFRSYKYESSYTSLFHIMNFHVGYNKTRKYWSNVLAKFLILTLITGQKFTMELIVDESVYC